MSLRVSRLYLVLVLIIGLSVTFSPIFAQNSTTQTKGYVKMEIGAMGLHCPFLGVTLIDQLEADTAFSEVTVDKSDHFLTFSYTENPIYTQEYFQTIAVNVGYPASIVIITLFDEQPPIEARE